MRMWNLIDLKCPSDIVEYHPQDSFLIEELRDFVSVLTTAADILTSENPIWKEMQVLRNIQVKYKIILRCDKCLIYLHRISHCLKKMILINLSKSYLDLAERFIYGFGLQDQGATMQLPSRQQVEYILIRTLSASKLVCEGIKYSQETFCYLVQKLKIGHLILDLVMASSVTARLNILLKGILEKMCTTYDQVLSWRYKLKRGSHLWSEKFDLPEDLKKWLKKSESKFLKPLPMTKNDMNILSSVLKTKNSNDSDTDSVVLINEVQYDDGSVPEEKAQEENNTDYGEIIPRKKRKKVSPALSTHQKILLQKIICVQTLKDLEEMWHYLNNSNTDFPKVITKEKKEIICKLFLRLRKNLSKKKTLSKKNGKQPGFLKDTLVFFSKQLGFTINQIQLCQDDPPVASNGTQVAKLNLEPVTTLKELRILYEQLRSILQSKNESAIMRKLQKIFKRRRTDIKLLKQNGEKKTAKKLTFCTSKVFLTVCKEYIQN